MALVKKILKVIGALFALLVVLILGALGYNMWQIHTRSVAAREAASALCAGLPPGSAIAPALEDAQRRHINAIELPAAAGFEFQFMYFLDGWGCRARVTDGKVTATEVVAVN